MRITGLAIIGYVGCLAPITGIAHLQAAGRQPQSSTAPAAVPAQQAFITQYCVTCHSQGLQTGGLVLETADLGDVSADAETWEKVVRKLHGGLMPPPGAPRPDRTTSEAFVSWLETQLDRAAAARPNPGRTETFHRLNRAEYRNAVRDLLGLDIDVSSLLPADGSSYGFDNMAGVLQVPPTLMERYLTAAKNISRAAVGTPPSTPNYDVFRVPADLPQDDRVDGLPFGTRGGTLIRYNFPGDGEYAIRVRLAREAVGAGGVDVPRYDVPQHLEVALDGERLQVFTLPASDRAVLAPGRYRREDRSLVDADWQVRFFAGAGPRDVSVTFINRLPALLESLNEPYLHPYPAGGEVLWGSRKGAYLGRVDISGPFEVRGRGDTPSRQRIFQCYPVDPSEKAACARTILSTLTRRAYRRPVTAADLEGPLRFYEQGDATGGFEAGIELAIRRLLVSPEFLFRTEAEPPDAASGTRSPAVVADAPASRPENADLEGYAVSDVELASRLSFFLWSSIPDDELLDLATQGRLRDPVVLETQVRRMLADGRSQALVDNFAGQWLYLRNVPSLTPDLYTYPDFNEGLRRAMKRETELFFEHIVREDRSVLDLLAADYTFLNESLARHYGLPNVYGEKFRRVTLPEGSVRGGLLGQASILAVTSLPNRTSPVVRGKWILENILGSPPPEPPADVPPLPEETGDGSAAMTMRQRIAAHRDNPVCASCHSLMDPLGLGLENFDSTGRWREVEATGDARAASFVPIDSSGAFPDGTEFSTVAELRHSLMARSDRFVATMTEKLLTYALGRGLEHYDAPAVRAIARDAAGAEYRLSALVLGVTKSVPFQMRRRSGS
ncbi:MAG: DUF1592 domain-containing protein [Acidobacteria bacterium]|nr:DUF1592 domain-containing protein [Acidobacteriota bacterium]